MTNTKPTLSISLREMTERAEKAEADNQRLRKDCDEHARWRADLADKLHDAEAELAALRLELARLDGEIPYGN